MKILLDKGANNAADARRYTPLHCACNGGNYDIVKLLIQNGAEVNCKNDSESTPSLHRSSYYDHVDVSRLLIDNGADINSKSGLGLTPLHIACTFGKLNTVKLLVEKGGADIIFIQNNSGQTPIQNAHSGDHYDIVLFFESIIASNDACTIASSADNGTDF